MKKTPKSSVDKIEKSTHGKIIRGYKISNRLSSIDGIIADKIEKRDYDVAERLIRELKRLDLEFIEIAKELSKYHPKVKCRASCETGKYALEVGKDYYVLGLPKGVSLSDVYIESTPHGTDLIINGKKYKGDWVYSFDEEDLLYELINLFRHVDIDGIDDLGMSDMKNDIEKETKSELFDDLSLDNEMIEKALDLFLANEKTKVIEVDKSDKELIKALYFIKNVAKYCEGFNAFDGGIASISIDRHLIPSELLRKYDTDVYHISKYYADYEIKIV